MKIAAIDSSGLVASVAIVEDDILVAEYTINHKKTHSQTLLPMLDELKKMLELDLHTLDAIAAAAGPGSFTGLRIGSATVKGLAMALQKPVISVPTVDALAWNLYGVDKKICPMMDARRNQVYTGIYTFVREEAGYGLEILEPQCAVSIEELAEKLNRIGQEVILLGDGVPVYLEQMKALLQVPCSVAPASCNRQRAAAVAVAAQRYYAQGKIENAREHVPEYLRLSQAERERKGMEQQ